MLLAGILAFAGGNAWLASKYGRAWLGRKVAARTGLEADVGPVTWTPWSGVRVRGLRLQAPGQEGAPLLEVRAIRVVPDLSQWRNRQLMLRRVEVDGPKITFTPEILRALLPKGEVKEAVPTAPPVAQPPELAQQTLPEQIGSLPAASSVSPSIVQPNVPQTGPVVIVPPVATPSPQPAKPAPPAPATSQPASPVVTTPTSWLVIREGEVVVEVAGKSSAIHMIEGEIPFGGAESTGALSWQSLRCGEENFVGGTVPVQWKTPIWRVGPWAGAIHGVKVEALAEGALRQGLPMQVRMLGRPQPWKGEFDQVKWEAKSCEFQAVWLGALQVPGSWTGRSIAHVQGIHATLEDRKLQFDDAILLVDQKGPVVQVRDVRLIGDELSLLGNATALSDGRFGAVLRAISAREQLPAVRDVFARRLSFPAERVEMRPLFTPDRWFFDLKIGGTPEKMVLQVK